MDRLSFEEWLSEVDGWIGSLTGLSHRDLADWTYRDAYEDGVSPKEAALSVMENEGFA